jgi:ATP-binding cassette subfamily A (ABC1) protein 3
VCVCVVARTTVVRVRVCHTCCTIMSFFRHFLALVRKNVQLKQRAFGSTFLELHLPVVFMALMLLLKRQFTTDVFSPRSHEDSATSIPPFFPLPAGLALSGSGGLLAVASSSSSGAAAAAAFFSHASAMYPPIPLGALGGGALAEVLPAEWRAAVLPGFNASAVAFPSEAALEAYIASQNYGRLGGPPPLYAAIVFNSGPPALDYTLRFNTSAVPYTQFFVNQWTNSFQNGSLLSYLSADAPSLDVNTASSLPPLPASGGYYPTLPGFLTLQTMVDRWAINASVAPAALDAAALLERFGGALLDVSALAFLPVAEALLQLNGTGRSAVAADLAAGGLRGETLAPQQIDVLPFPVGAYTQNIFYQAILSSLTLLFVLAWVYSVSTLIAALVDEKEKRMRESMLSMGLGQLALYSSWFATYAAMTLVVAAEISVVGVVLFPASSALLVFALFAAWGFSTITFCFLLSSFFTQAKVASVLGAALFILAFFSTYGLSETTPAASRVLYSLLCPAALDQAVMVLAALETDGVGLTASSLFSARVNDWTVGDSLRMLLLDTVLYGLLAAYADAVMPTALRDFGVPRPLYFPCTPRFWAREVCGCKAPRGSGKTLVGHGEPAAPPAGADVALFDDLDGDGRTALAAERAITVRGLKKVFPSPDGGTLTAVAGLDLDIVEGQIFVLLGHNGAGKTTTLSMLTGMLPPTEGGARIYGKDLGSELGAIRAELGVCPQHDVLWPSLTVSEHLELFAALKGVPPERVATEAAASLAMVGLTEKLRAPVCTLSGGQKRKLSVCIAFLGGSRVVFLDEPTSGMDPYSRRSTWEILQNARAGRVIVLTTHFMDEADILGDRVGIMADGGLRCVGSPLFLKERYGLGYTVTAILKPASAAASGAAAHAPLLALAREHVADATLAGAAGCEVALRAPLAASTAFPALLRDLAGARGAALGVETAGVHVTSVEDVFLRVAHAEEARRGAGAGAKADTPGAAAASPAGGSVEEVRAAARPRLSGGRAFATHFNAIFNKRLRYARRDYRAICCLLLMPVVSLCLGLGFLLRANWASGEPDMQLSTAQFNSASPTAPLGGGAPNRVPAFSFKAGEAVDSVDLASILGRFPNTTFDGGALQLGVAAAAALDTLNGTYGLCTAAENSTARAWQRMATLLLHDAPSFKESLYGAVVFLGADGTALKGQGAAAALNAASGNANITYSVMVNTTAQHAGPIFVNLANSALLQSSPGGGGAGASIAARSHPLPYTPFQAANVLATQGFAITQVLLLSLAFVTPAFIQFVVREREVKAKHQQLISGVSIPAYCSFKSRCPGPFPPCAPNAASMPNTHSLSSSPKSNRGRKLCV